MTSMDHFAIEDMEFHDRFQTLAVGSNNLYKEDFLESSYFVDEVAHLEKVSKGATASGRGGSSS